ncbi:MAG: FeoA family protein [Clostridiaceae bacterium]
MVKKLTEISIGTSAKVEGICKESRFKRRLMDMGIIPGVNISVTGKAPLGDPIEILIRGYKLTLRKNEASDIQVIV